MDGRKNNGGHKTNGGRKPKADEQKLIEKLSPLEPIALKALKKCVKNNDGWAVKLYFEYMYGKPKQQLDVTTGGDKLNINPIQWIDEPEQEV